MSKPRKAASTQRECQGGSLADGDLSGACGSTSLCLNSFFCPRVWASDAPSVVLSVSSLQHSSTLTSNSAEQAATMHTHCLLHSRPHSSLNSLPSGHRLLRRWRQCLMSLHVPLAITTGFTHDLCQQMPA